MTGFEFYLLGCGLAAISIVLYPYLIDDGDLKLIYRPYYCADLRFHHKEWCRIIFGSLLSWSIVGIFMLVCILCWSDIDDCDDYI